MTGGTVCHAPLNPMTIGGSCDQCGHPAPAHSNNGPCIMCWVEDRFSTIERLVAAWKKENL